GAGYSCGVHVLYSAAGTPGGVRQWCHQVVVTSVMGLGHGHRSWSRRRGGWARAGPGWARLGVMFTTRPELLGTFGMVGSTHWLASSTGMAVLEDGGNAYDAAVAAGFVLHVVEPHLNGVGGEMPLIGHEGATGRTFVVCGQGT